MKFILTPHTLTIMTDKPRVYGKDHPLFDRLVTIAREKSFDQLRKILGDFSCDSEYGELSWDEDTNLGEFFFDCRYHTLPLSTTNLFKDLIRHSWAPESLARLCHGFLTGGIGNLDVALFLVKNRVTLWRDGTIRVVRPFSDKMQETRLEATIEVEGLNPHKHPEHLEEISVDATDIFYGIESDKPLAQAYMIIRDVNFKGESTYNDGDELTITEGLKTIRYTNIADWINNTFTIENLHDRIPAF